MEVDITQDNLCNACWNLANNMIRCNERPNLGSAMSTVGHSAVCVNCGRSILRIRFHQLNRDTEREQQIYNVIKEWIMPRTLEPRSSICHSCWVRANRVAPHYVCASSTSASRANDNEEEYPVIANEPVNEPANTVQANEFVNEPANIVQEEIRNVVNVTNYIVLPDYTRAPETQSGCFIQGCPGRERNRIPLSARKFLLCTYKYYVPKNNRLCNNHLAASWEFLNEITNHVIDTFSAEHITDMLSLKDTSNAILDFENISNMQDHIFYFWVGLTKVQFEQLLAEVPQLNNSKRGKIGLAIYLTKLRTGDSNDRLATLLNMPRSSLELLMKNARFNLDEYFVPRHLGINHINRQQLMGKNLIIPNGLFGFFNNEQRPVIIFDGTYTYVQKSSNYLYQKNTYSLHKYRNLVKPFLMVATDGCIIDVLGPYPATTSDADIMAKEFRETSVLREYFQPGDAFVLDRGFRDALPLLNECGYRTYVPASLQEGETQLSTIEANKSRAVTICRWVVEVVYGRFKRDFKLFRQEYFSTASKHLMIDFQVAAALINVFHPPIVNRDEAEEILQIINQNMYVQNTLADYIQLNNMNRRGADFQSITVNNENVREFPQLTFSELIKISLGSYQLKQACSYYGEHIRENGVYLIEVCREVDDDLRELSTSEALWLLRGRISSRHISRKIYFVYVLVDSSLAGREAILQYCCNCIVRRRTVGCCAHVMSAIWYLAWARYQDNVTPPALFLDSILIFYDDDDE